MAEGRATISFQAENTDLKAKTAESEGVLNKFKSAAGGAGGSIGRMASSAKAAAGAFTSVIGAVGGVIAAFTAAKAIGEKLNEVFESGQRRAEKFIATLDMSDSTKALSNAETLAKRRLELEEQLAQTSFENVWNQARSNDALQNELTIIQRQEKALRAQAVAQQQRAREAEKQRQSEEAAAKAADEAAKVERERLEIARQRAAQEAEIANTRSEADMAMAQVQGDAEAARVAHLQQIAKLESDAAKARNLEELIAFTDLVNAKEEIYRQAMEKRAADERRRQQEEKAAAIKAAEEEARAKSEARVKAARRERDELKRLRDEQEGSPFGSLGGIDYYGRGGSARVFGGR